MVYRHGVYTTEIPTSVTPAVSSATVPVVFGTAPVNMSTRETVPVNEPILCMSYAEAVNAFGYSEDWRFTLCEFIYSHFTLFAASPAILINVLDPDTMTTSESDQPVSIDRSLGVIETQGILKESVAVKSSDGETTYDADTDYALNFDSEGNLLIQILPNGSIPGNTTELSVSYDALDPSKVTSTEIIGGVNSDGKETGLELINQIFPRFRIAPSMIVAPGFSTDPTVAAIMTAKGKNINGSFKALSLVDIPTDEVLTYSEVPQWKNDNNYMDEHQVVCWPKLAMGDKVFHMSSQLASLMCVIDSDNDNVPYISPSNNNYQANGAVLEDGTPVFLGPDTAAYLNGEGVVTALNFIGGWKAWGNRTGAYPSTTDPKDSFIPVRRMFDWIQTTLILTYWQQLDAPISRRLTETITDSVNIWLNGLAAQGAILGGRVEFNQAENPEADLMDGIVRFHVYVTPPSPAREIDFIVEYDVEYLNGIFG